MVYVQRCLVVTRLVPRESAAVSAHFVYSYSHAPCHVTSCHVMICGKNVSLRRFPDDRKIANAQEKIIIYIYIYINAFLDILLHEQQVPACCQTHSDYRPSKKAVKADTVKFANWLSLPSVVNDNENK